ncbi:MAG TPA: hypothetical protein VGP31_05765 [Planosporangium sp.]|jgi:hypothetical protein|nr:hypothetical protein [Planosporangium sp.]
MTISPARSVLTTVLATVGFAVNSATWLLISAIEPYLQQRYRLGPVSRVAVVAVLTCCFGGTGVLGAAGGLAGLVPALVLTVVD